MGTNVNKFVILEDAATTMVVENIVREEENTVTIFACRIAMEISLAPKFLARLRCQSNAPVVEGRLTFNVEHLRKD